MVLLLSNLSFIHSQITPSSVLLCAKHFIVCVKILSVIFFFDFFPFAAMSFCSLNLSSSLPTLPPNSFCSAHGHFEKYESATAELVGAAVARQIHPMPCDAFEDYIWRKFPLSHAYRLALIVFLCPRFQASQYPHLHEALLPMVSLFTP